MERVNNASWCCEQIEEKLKEWKIEIEKSRNGCSESCITNLPCTETNIMFNPNYYKSI